MKQREFRNRPTIWQGLVFSGNAALSTWTELNAYVNIVHVEWEIVYDS